MFIDVGVYLLKLRQERHYHMTPYTGLGLTGHGTSPNAAVLSHLEQRFHLLIAQFDSIIASPEAEKSSS